MAALDAATGALRAGFVPPSNGGGRYTGHTGGETHDGNDGAILDFGVTSDGRYLVVGGDFLDFGGRSGLLVLDGASGQPAPWQPVDGPAGLRRGDVARRHSRVLRRPPAGPAARCRPS